LSRPAAEFADGVHHLAEQFLVGDPCPCSSLVAGALHDFAAEAFNFVAAMPRKLSSSASPDSSCSLSISSVFGRASGWHVVRQNCGKAAGVRFQRS
jgi:hypothetical protein